MSAKPQSNADVRTLDDADKVADVPFEALQTEANALREKLNRFRVALGRFFVDKQALIDLMVVSAVAQEPLLLVGPPGTAKTDLVVKFREAMNIPDVDYF